MAELLDPDSLCDVVAAVLGRPDLTVHDLGRVSVVDADHRIDNMTTAGLHRVSGTLTDGTQWRAFAKVLHPASASPLMQYVPPEHHASVMENLNWLDEPAVYRSGLASDLPDGLRMPRLWHVVEDDSRIVLWIELVDAEPTWGIDDYRRAARSLGAMAGRWPEDRVDTDLGLRRRDLAYLFFGKLANVDLPVVADDAHWADPVVANVTDAEFRRELDALIARAPGRIAEAETLPHAMSHGDATPHNLLRTDDALVAIDWSYGSSGPLGADLGQLLAGRFDTGEAEPDDAPKIAAVLLDAYLDGLAEEGVHADPAQVLTGWSTHLAIRSVISSTVLDHRPDLDDEARARLLERRVAVAKVGLELDASR